MPRYKALFLTGIFALVVSLVPLSRADDDVDSQARIVRISHVQGEVRIDSGHGYENATMNVPITQGDWLHTSSDGWAEVQMEDGSTIRLAPDTQIIFSQLARLSSGGTVTTVDLDQGEAEFKITKRGDSEFQVTVNKKTIVLDSSGRFRVTSTNSDPLEIAVWQGSVGVRDPDSGGEVAVLKNETFQLDAQDLSRYALDKGAEADELDQWSQQRDDYLSKYASAGSGYAQSPYRYGASDLDQYGQYSDVPGYGYVWQPNGVSLDWDPFMNGYWNYSPTVGNYWVSAYPWGWMPFRYGNWIFVHGRGWCWKPGGWNRWHRSPTLVNAPPGFRRPTPPPRTVVSGGRDDLHRQQPRLRAPGQIDRDHGHNNLNGGGAGVPQDTNQHRATTPGAPGRIAGDHGHNTLNRGGVDPQNADPQNTDPQGGGGRVKRRVFTNDNVQSSVPPASAPAPPTAQPGSGFTPMERRPKVIERGNGVARSSSGIDAPVQGAGQQPVPVVTRPVETRVERTRFSSSPAPEQHTLPMPSSPPVKQYTPPVQHAAPPPPVQQSQPVRQFTPPAPAPQPRQAPPAAAPKQTDNTELRGRQR